MSTFASRADARLSPPDDAARHGSSVDPRKRRLLALSGGGVRGIVEVAFLEAVEAAYKRRFGPETRLCDVFDLVGGSSTGALIATAVSLGHEISQIRDFYLLRATQLFCRRRWWRFGRAPIFDCMALEREIRADVGSMTLGDESLRTLLAIIIKRLDISSAWVVNNLPNAPYFEDPPDRSFLGNRNFELAALLRATTAAPIYFSHKMLSLDENGNRGLFVDGGLTPYNDPSLALLRLARMRAYGLNWSTGPDKLFILSIGTGRLRSRFDATEGEAMSPLAVLGHALRGLISDNERHTLTMMEWLGTSPDPQFISTEIGRLDSDYLTEEPLFSFLRLDLPLDPGGPLGLTRKEARRLFRLEAPEIIRPLYDLAREHAARTWDLDRLLS